MAPHASKAAFIDGAATARSKKPTEAWYVFSFVAIALPLAGASRSTRKRQARANHPAKLLPKLPRHEPRATTKAGLWAFDLLERDGEDLRHLPLERRKDELKALLKRAPFGLALNDYATGDGPALFAQACAIGLEGIVSKRRSSPYRSDRSPHWLKAKNPESPAARREALEDWGRKARW